MSRSRTATATYGDMSWECFHPSCSTHGARESAFAANHLTIAWLHFQRRSDYRMVLLPRSVSLASRFDRRRLVATQAWNFEVETFEARGTYKLNMGKFHPGMKRSPVQMVKENFRMVGAVVKTKDRGNWFFRLVGPDETVRSSREAFLEMLRSVR